MKDSYLELSANDLFHANKHSYAVEEGDIDLSLEDIVYSLENIEQGIVEKAIQRKMARMSLQYHSQRVVEELF